MHRPIIPCHQIRPFLQVCQSFTCFFSADTTAPTQLSGFSHTLASSALGLKVQLTSRLARHKTHVEEGDRTVYIPVYLGPPLAGGSGFSALCKADIISLIT
jgi:hypothetical protein